MRTRSVCLISAVGLVAWSGALGATAGARARTAVCGPAGAHTIASDSLARVYSSNQTVYGCARHSHSRYRLGTTSNSMHEGRVGPVALAGVDVAYGLSQYGVDVVSAQVMVKRLTDGVVLRDRDAYQGPARAESSETVNDIVVKSDGSVAWIASFSSIPSSGPTGIEVLKSDRTSRTLLDRSGRIATRSLQLVGSRLTWKDGSAKLSATLS